MRKEQKSAEELASMIAHRLNDYGTIINVFRHEALGWTAVAYSRGSAAPGLQVRVDAIAQDLRERYEMT